MKKNCLYLFILLFTALTSFSQPQRSYFEIQPKDPDIIKLYTGLLDRDIAAALGTFDITGDLSDVFEVQDISSAGGKNQKWDTMRAAALAGGLSFAYSTPQSKYYGNMEILARVEQVFGEFSSHQSDDGTFQLSLQARGMAPEPVVTALLLEPFISSYALIHTVLPDDRRKQYDRMIRRGLAHLVQNRASFDSYKGMISAAVLSAGYRCTGDKAYLNAAQEIFQRIKNDLFLLNGIVNPEYSPNISTSGASLQYLFLYRRMTDNKELEPLLLRCLDWFIKTHALSGVSLVEPSAAPYESACNAMGALTFFGEREEVFQQTATRFLESFIRSGGGYTLSHGGWHFMHGAVHHQRPKELPGVGYKPYGLFYETDRALYYLVGKNYQTAVVLRSRSANKGLQVWSYKGQPPLISPSLQAHSFAAGFGYDSSLIDAAWSKPDSYTLTHLDNDIEVLTTRQGTLTTSYIFSTDVTVVMYRDMAEQAYVDWAMNLDCNAALTEVTSSRVLFGNSAARIFVPQIQPETSQKWNSSVLRFHYNSDYCWFIFAGPQSAAVVQPVFDGLALVQIAEGEKKMNLTVNTIGQAFAQERYFPNTQTPIPPTKPYSAALVDTNQ